MLIRNLSVTRQTSGTTKLHFSGDRKTCADQQTVDVYILSTYTYCRRIHTVHVYILYTYTYCRRIHTVHVYMLSTYTYCRRIHTFHVYILSTYTYCRRIHTVHVYILYTYTYCPRIHTINNSAFVLCRKIIILAPSCFCNLKLVNLTFYINCNTADEA